VDVVATIAIPQLLVLAEEDSPSLKMEMVLMKMDLIGDKIVEEMDKIWIEEVMIEEISGETEEKIIEIHHLLDFKAEVGEQIEVLVEEDPQEVEELVLQLI